MSEEKEKEIQFASLPADMRNSAKQLAGVINFAALNGISRGAVAIGEQFGYEVTFDDLTPEQRKELNEAGARAIVYLAPDVSTNPVVVYLAVLSGVLMNSARVREIKEIPEPKPVDLTPTCCKNWEWTLAHLNEAGVKQKDVGVYVKYGGHHPSCKNHGT